MNWQDQSSDMEKVLTILQNISTLINNAAIIGEGGTIPEIVSAFTTLVSGLPAINTAIINLQNNEAKRRIQVTKILKDDLNFINQINKLK